MKIPYAILIALLLTAATTAPSTAHSLSEVQGMLGDREKYFQPIDREPPDFTLEDAEGGAVSLDDLRGKVVVLHFVYTNCPDVCPLHAERIAEVQGMVNQTPMRDLVKFVTITTDPGHDAPAVMREYGSAHGLHPVNWMFLTSGRDRPEDATRNLAERFGRKFTRTEDGYQIHGVVTPLCELLHTVYLRGGVGYRWVRSAGEVLGLSEMFYAPASRAAAIASKPSMPHGR